MNKLNILTAAILAVVSTAAISAPQPANQPPVVSGIYDNGPSSPLVASTDLSLAERSAYANYEAIMQIAEARIHATSCSNSAGTFSVTAFSDGSTGNPSQNFATVVSPGGSFRVATTSTLSDPLPPNGNDRGQQLSVNQSPASGILSSRAVQNYRAAFAYNSQNNLLDGISSVSVFGINGRFDQYVGKVIKDFYRGALTAEAGAEFYNIYDWGLQSLDKEGYPVNKYWQRSKSHRSDGSIGRTIFVKDRLVGATSCRITIDTLGDNNQDFFSQKGSLTIQAGVNPSAPVPAFNDLPF